MAHSVEYENRKDRNLQNFLKTTAEYLALDPDAVDHESITRFEIARAPTERPPMAENSARRSLCA